MVILIYYILSLYVVSIVTRAARLKARTKAPSWKPWRSWAGVSRAAATKASRWRRAVAGENRGNFRVESMWKTDENCGKHDGFIYPLVI